MLRLIGLALAGLLALVQPLNAAGTIPGLSLSQRFDNTTQKPLSGGLLYFYQAGTTTPQNVYQDTALTLPYPNPYKLDAGGNIPQLFAADGQIKFRLTNSAGVTQQAFDNILVVGPSGGGGGGGSVDPTTVMATGDIKSRYGTGVLTGFVRMNGRTIGSATSGATERANADCQALFEYLWGTDPALVVSTGRGATANADWVANKTITLPDLRNRAIAGLGDMGNTDAARLTAAYFGASGTTLGAAGGSQSHTISIPELPVLAPTFVGSPGTVGVLTDSTSVMFGGVADTGLSSGPFTIRVVSNATSVAQIASHGTFTPSGSIVPFGGGGTMSIASPMMLATIYIKL